MNVNYKTRGLLSNKFFISVAISTLLLHSAPIMATHATISKATDTSQEQKISASGIIIDTQGEPIVGASVMEKGTINGSISDLNGKFVLSVASDATLVISYIGYQKQELKATAAMRVVLKDDNAQLQEVVVVGYGAQKKENLTGAVASIDVGKTLDSRPIADVGRGLQGVTAGLSVMLSDAEVGSDPSIKIRGQYASIRGSSGPLLLLDNVEIPSITLVNPDDIESISVLKDAAASSIYGAKAAFGVILITSKKGARHESIRVTYSGNFSWQSTAKGYNMGGVEAMQYIADANKNMGVESSGAFYRITEEGLAKAREWQQNYGGKLGTGDPTVYGRDWYVNAAGQKIGLRTYDAYDYMIRQGAPTQSHNLSINGKSGNTSYNIGLGYLDQSGMNKVAKDDSFQRYNASVKVSTQFNKHVTFNAGAIYSKRTKNYPYTTQSALDGWYYLYRWGDQYPLGLDENGNQLRSPASEFSQANTAKVEQNYTNINLGVHLDITKDWTVDIDYTHANEETNWLRPGVRFTAANTWTSPVERFDTNGNRVYVNNHGQVVSATTPGAMAAYDLKYETYTGSGSTPDNINRRSTNSKRNTINAYTTYNLNIEDHHLFKLMLGMNRVDYVTEYHQAQKANLLDLENVQFGNANGTQTVTGSKSWEAQLGFFGRLNYSLFDKYLVEANLRYDATSKFPTDLQWRWFPSFSAGWRTSEESFMQWAKPTLSSLKIRSSWGVIGDQTVPNGLYTSNLGSITQSNWLDENGNYVNMVYTPTAVASNITWQDIQTFDIGFDARFFNNAMGITFDWYQRDTKNMIVGAEGVAATYGTTAPQGNYGNLRTQGWEISVDYNHSFNNGLNFNAMLTLSDAITVVTKYGSSTGIGGWYNGKQYGEIWGYRTDRLYQKDDFDYDANGNLIRILLDQSHGAQNAGKWAYKLKGDKPVYQAYLQSGNFMFSPGDVKFLDRDGDGQITDGSRAVNDHGDLEKIGNTTPRYEFGLRLGADYKGFDLSLFFQGVAKRDMWGSSATTLAGFNTSDGAVAKRFTTNYWTEGNTGAFYPRAWNQANATDAFNMRVQDRYLLNMSYLRVKNVTLGYTLPAHITTKAWINRARIYMSIENLFTFDHLEGTPLNPETVAGIGSGGLLSDTNYQLGRAGLSTPAFKSFSVGFQLNF